MRRMSRSSPWHEARSPRDGVHVLDPIDLRFDRGTLRIQGAGADNLPFAVWDERVSGWRAPAHRYAAIGERVTASGAELHAEIAPRLCARVRPRSPPDRPAH